MAPDCSFNNMGPAQNDNINLWITYYNLTFILTLFAIPLFVQSTRTLNRAYFCKPFDFVHSLFLHTFYGIVGLYQLAQECKQIEIQQDKITRRQRQVQPPIDQFIIVPDLPTIQQEYSLQSLQEYQFLRRTKHIRIHKRITGLDPQPQLAKITRGSYTINGSNTRGPAIAWCYTGPNTVITVNDPTARHRRHPGNRSTSRVCRNPLKT